MLFGEQKQIERRRRGECISESLSLLSHQGGGGGVRMERSRLAFSSLIRCSAPDAAAQKTFF